jgi:AmmeMemoRadiSam system protein B/AmmeMemoRadiSam system protein A
MKKKCLLFIAVLFLSVLAAGQDIRKPFFAGQFYDSRPQILSQQIDDYLRQSQVRISQPGNLVALVVPHAGYVCSGPVAAFAYRLVKGEDFETVVIVGTSHRSGLNGCSVYPEGGYQTPLGVAQIDSALSREIRRISGFRFVPLAHQNEHSIEVQVPFIQKVLPRAKIVPILVGAPSPETSSILAQSLVKAMRGKKCLLVVSTDLSHYYPKEKANAVDRETLSLIQQFNTDTITRKLQRGENIMCGGGGVVSALLYAQALGDSEVEILRYADSSDTCGPPTEVVGYAAVAVYTKNEGQPLSLSEESKRELLVLARSSVERFVRHREVIDPSTRNPELQARRGIFVTLRKKDILRGCIGFVEPVVPLCQSVIQAAIYACSKDSRFNPVAPEELEEIEIEISILTPMRKISDPSLVEVGKHGLFVNWNGRNGLLLPQVPVENGWSRKEFLEQTCQKAGLPKNAWKSEAELFVFEAIVFHDSEPVSTFLLETLL